MTEKSLFVCSITLTIDICSFSHSHPCHLLSLPSISLSLPPSFPLLWAHQSEHERNIISKQVVFHAMMFRSGLLIISDGNGNDYYIKKHWLNSCTTVYFYRLTGTHFLSSLLRLPKKLTNITATLSLAQNGAHCDWRLALIKLLALESNKTLIMLFIIRK